MTDKARWAEAAYEILVGVAGRYHAVIEYGELGREVQERTGITTRVGVQNWIGSVLELVVRRCHDERLPPLTALVVRKDSGMVGEGYDAVLKVAGIEPLDDATQREEHAAEARLDCYRRFHATGLPADGGVAAMAPAYAASLERRARARRPDPVVEVCPRCHLALLASGRCDNCD